MLFRSPPTSRHRALGLEVEMAAHMIAKGALFIEHPIAIEAPVGLFTSLLRHVSPQMAFPVGRIVLPDQLSTLGALGWGRHLEKDGLKIHSTSHYTKMAMNGQLVSRQQTAVRSCRSSLNFFSVL